MPQSDILTGINPIDNLAIQKDTEQRLNDVFGGPSTFNPASNFEVPKGIAGTVAPGDNINIDKSSYQYQEAFNQKLLQDTAKQYPDTFHQLPTIQLPQSDTRRYIDQDYGFRIDRDNEDFYNGMQGPVKEFGKSLFLRLPLLTLSKLGTGVGYLAGLANPVNWFEKNYISSASDNFISKAFSGLEDKVKNDWLPIYQKAAARNMGFFDRALGGDQTFWYGDVVDAAAFMASAYVPAAILNKLQLGTKLLTGLGMTADEGLAASGNYLQKMGQYALKNADMALTTAVNTASESLFEARQIKDDLTQKLQATGKYTDKEIEDMVGEKMKNSFLSNLAALSFSNAWESNLFFKSLNKGKGIHTGDARLAEGSLLADYALPKVEGRVGKFLNSPLGFYSKKFLEGMGVEAFYEENIQQAVQQYNENTVEDKTPNTLWGYTAGVMKRMYNQTIDAFQGKDRDTAMNIGVGALIGGFFGTSMTALSGERKEERQHAEIALAALNQARNNWLKIGDIYSIAPDGTVHTDHAKAASIFVNQAVQAEGLNDTNKIQDPNTLEIAKKHLFAGLVSSHVENGSIKQLLIQLEALKTAKPEELIKLGFNPEENTLDKIEEYKDYAKRLEEVRHMVNKIHAQKDDPKGFIDNYRNNLYDIEAKRIANQYEINHLSRRVSELNSKIGSHDATDDLVQEHNSLVFKQELQTNNINQSPDESKHIYEERLKKYAQAISQLTKENEDSLSNLRKDSRGMYAFKNEERKNNPLAVAYAENLSKKVMLENANDILLDQYNDQIANRDDSKKAYGAQIESMVKFMEEVKKKKQEEVAKQKEVPEVKQNVATPPATAPAGTPAPVVVAKPTGNTEADEKRNKVAALLSEMNAAVEVEPDFDKKKEIRKKFVDQIKELSFGKTVDKPGQEQDKNFEELKNSIPKEKKIDITVFSELNNKIKDAKEKGDINESQEYALFKIMETKEVRGSIFDDPEDNETDAEDKEKIAEKEDDLSAEEVIEEPVIENYESAEEYNPETESIEDPTEIADEIASLIAYQTSNKTVTQQEEKPGVLDEDPYKVFKQGLLAHFEKDPDLFANFAGKIVKDNLSLPHSVDSEAFVRSGNAGSVLVITDNDGNFVYFDKNYNKANQPTEGYQLAVYSFSDTYWKNTAEQRAELASKKTGLTVDEWIQHYDSEAREQVLARQLNDQGKDVVVDLGYIVPGQLKRGSTYTPTSSVVSLDIKSELYIPPAPAEKFDPTNPKSTIFSFVGGKQLVNGAAYLAVEDPYTKSTNYIRILPNKISAQPELVASISNLLNHKYTDKSEAEQVADYLNELLFFDRVKRPVLKVDQVGNHHELRYLHNKKVIPMDVAFDTIVDQRLNIIKSLVDHPEVYPFYDIKNGDLKIENREDYTHYVILNSTTKQLPLKTANGLRYVAVNSYMTFQFRESEDELKNRLAAPEDMRPGERPKDFKPNEIGIWRHGETMEDVQGMSSGTNSISISSEGVKNATSIGEFWKNNGITGKVYSSTINRAMETANIAAKVAGIKNVLGSDLLKTWDLGKFTSIPSDQFDEKYYVTHPDEKIPGGESFNNFVDRMIKARDYFSKIATPKDAIISHSRAIRVWDALKLNNGLRNDNFVEKYLNLSTEYSFTSFANEEGPHNNATLTKKTFKRIDVEDEGLKAIRTTENRPEVTSAEVESINKIFGKEIAQLVDDVSNSDAAALWTTSGIKLYRDAKQGDGYHEAWHHFSQIYLTEGQKRALYDEIRKKDIGFKTRDGRNLKSRSASDFDLEEMVADDFRDYVLSNGRSRLVDRPNRNTIFRKILDFLKKFFFGEVNLSRLYDDLYKGNLNSYKPSINNARWGKLNAQTINQKGDQIFDAQKSAYYRNVLDYFMGKHLRLKSYSPEALRKDKSKAESVYKNMRADIVKNYYHPILDKSDAGTISPKEEALAEDLYQLLYNYEDFIQFHKSSSKLFLNIPYEISLPNEIDESNDTSIEDELGSEGFIIKPAEDDESDFDDIPKDDASVRPLYDRAGNEQSSWEGATLETRSLIRMLPAIDPITKAEKLDPNGFPKLNDYAKTWNNLASEISNLETYAEMYAKMSDSEVQKKIPELTVLLTHLPNPGKDHTAAEINTMIGFRKSFDRSYIGIYSGKTTLNGTFWFNEETKRNKDLIRRIWTANFLNKSFDDPDVKGESILVDEATGKNYLNPEHILTYKVSTPAGKQDLMNLLGFSISEKAKNTKFYKTEMTQYLSNVQDNINARHANGQKIFNPIYDLKTDLKDVDKNIIVYGLAKTLEGFIEFESDFNEDVPTLSYRTAEGTMIHGLSLNHTLSIVSNKLNKAQSYLDIKNDPSTQHLNIDNNPYVRGSMFLQHMFVTESNNTDNLNRRKRASIIIGNYNGPKYEDEDGTVTGFSTTSLNIRQKIVFDMNSFLSRGAIDIMRTESSKTSYFMKLSSYPNANGMDKSSLYLPIGASQFTSSFRSGSLMNLIIDNYLRDELNRMKTADSVDIYKSDSDLLNAAKGYNLFADILVTQGANNQALKEKIKNSLENKTPEEIIDKNRAEIELAIENFFIGQYNSFIKGLANNNITSEDMAKSLLPNTSFAQKVRTFLVNDFILNVEYTKIFNGDTVYQIHYKDYFKRSKGDISTGLTPITDDAFARHMKKGEANTFAGFVKSTWNNDYKTVQTININDDIRKSNYVPIWKENLKQTNPELTDEQIDKLLDKYNKVNVADGQGHITLDFYRQFLKSINNWSDDQERQYQVELAQYRLDHANFNDDYTNEMRHADRDFLSKNPQTYAYFPPIKMQYNGPIKAKGTFAPVMDKFSVAPLIPSIIKNTPLEDLNFQMLKKGVGYSKFVSGTKKFRQTPIDMYNQDGYKEIDLSNHEPALHFLPYLKEQINTRNAVKEESIFGSQVRKLIEANIFSQGKATEQDLSRHKQYLNILQKMKEIGKEELYKDLGIKEIKNKDGQAMLSIGNIEGFVATLQDQIEKRELNDNIRNYIQVNDRGLAVIDPTTTIDLLYPLEASLNRRSIQDLIMGVIDRRLRLQKINGDQLFQISSSGFQSKDFKYKEATPEEIKQYGTNGLRFYHLGEDGKTVSSQVKVGLNGDFLKLLEKSHPDGKKIGSLERLNALLKDDKWVNENRKKITLIGYRIPTQGHNSMEFMEVAEFLPGHVGSSIIVPAEIVSKAGSDFDIDKMSIFRPSLDDQGNIVTGDSKEGLGNQVISLFKEILSDPRNFKQLIKPNDTELIHGTVDQVAVALGKRKQSEVLKPEPYKRTQIYRYQTNIRKFESLLSAQRLLAVFAVSNTFTTLLQQAGIQSNTKYGISNGPTRSIKLFLLSPKEREQVVKGDKIDISNKFDVEGNLKQDYTNQLINATVDAPSDDFFGYSNINYENVGVLGYLMNQGVPFDRAFWFLHQPVLMQYYQDLRQRPKGVSKAKVMATILGNLKEKNYDKVLDDGRVVLDYKSYNNDINAILNDPSAKDTFLNVENLKKTTKKISDIPEWLANDKAKRFNSLILAYFVSLQEQSNLFNNFRKVLNFDTTKTKSPLYAWQQAHAMKQVEANKLFTNEDIKAMASQTTVSSFDNRVLIAQIGRTLMPNAFNGIFMRRAALKVTKDTEYKTKAFKNKYIANYENQWIEYIVKSLGKVGDKSLQSYSKYLLEGRDNIARRFNDLMAKYPTLKQDYNFVSRIRPNFPNKPDVKKSNLEVYRLFENNQDDQNEYIQEFRNLINFSDPTFNPEQQVEIRTFFKDLAIAAFVQSGFSKSNISFQELVPYEYLSDIFKNAMVNFNKYISSDKDLMEKYVSEFNQQFNVNEKNFNQPWRGKDYYLSTPISDEIRKKTSKEDLVKSQINTESQQPEFKEDEVAPWEQADIVTEEVFQESRDMTNDTNGDPVQNITSEEISTAPRGKIAMQPDNIEKIKQGRKSITNRTEDLSDGIYIMPDGTKIQLKLMGKAKVDLTNGFVEIGAPLDEDWNLDEFAKAEGFKDWDDFEENNKFSKSFVAGRSSRYVYSINAGTLIKEDEEDEDIVLNITEREIRDGLSEPLTEKVLAYKNKEHISWLTEDDIRKIQASGKLTPWESDELVEFEDKQYIEVNEAEAYRKRILERAEELKPLLTDEQYQELLKNCKG